MADPEEASEAEIQELVERLERLIPRDGAHLTIPSGPDGSSTTGNRRGYLRFGLEFLAAALRPLPATEEAPARIVPDIEYLLSEDSRAPFELCEIDESIVSRPPVRTGLGPLGELLAGLLVVGALIVMLVGLSVVVRWIFG